MQTYQEIMSEIENKEYSIIRLSKQNIKHLAQLHAQVYSTKVSEDYFKKKYNTAYTGIENVGFLVYNKNDKPVAFYGVVPCFIKFENELILVAQSTDTMTHPEYRYQGMFVELSTMTFDLCKKLNIRLVFGFPNENSYHGAVTKLGWIETERMNLFTIDVKSLPLHSFLKKIKLRKLYNLYCHYILKKWSVPLNGVDNSVLQDGFTGVDRNENYLLYKTYTSTKVLKIDDCKIWISNRNNLLIGDIEGMNQNNFTGVIHQLKNMAKKIGVKKIQFLCCEETKLDKIFASGYKSEKSFPVLFQNFGSPVSLNKMKFTFADIDIF